MLQKYSNIFWHEGVKIFKENILDTESGRIRVDHLENDVTKSLLNVFEHCGDKVLSAFLRMINVKKAPSSFEFDFQVTESEKFSQQTTKIMLSIVSNSFQTKSNPTYSAKKSRPDACIYSADTAILIESKTQSPLIEEQIDSHIKEYLGSTAIKRIITWENISERFNNLKNSLNPMDSFLVTQFCDFLNLIGVAEFNGYSMSDFRMLGMGNRMSKEDWTDFHRVLRKKNEKFIKKFSDEIEPHFNFKSYATHVTSGFSLIYFYDNNPKIGVNHYPNLTFNLAEYGLNISLNAEIKPSFRKVLNCLKTDSDEFNKIANKLTDYYFSLYYKLQYRPRRFIWNLVPSFPIKMTDFQSENILMAMDDFGKNWEGFRSTLLFQMETGVLKFWDSRFYNKTEIEYAESNNPKPNFVIRIEKRYKAKEIDKLGKNIFRFLKNEILKLKKLVQFVTK